MLEVKKGLLTFTKYKVIYTQHGKELEAYTSDKKWWENFASKWDHTEIVEFEDTSFTDEQKERLKEVEHLGEEYSHYAEEYVLNGKFPNETENEEERVEQHPLRMLQLKKENQMLGQSLTESEIKNFFLEHDMGQLGQHVTDLELKILMQGME